MAPATARTQYREVLASLVAKTQARFPALNGRLTKATRLALLEDVELHDDGSATVHSASDPTRRYRIIEGTCTCRDFEQAPEHLCQHRLAAGLVRKAHALLPPPTEAPPASADAAIATTPAPVAALPEAPASCNVRVTIGGREVQWTLRDTDEARLGGRLEALLARYPLSQPPAQAASQAPAEEQRWCPKHGDKMQLNHKDGRTWYSHKTAEGWCKGK
jgi:hypothetical protein